MIKSCIGCAPSQPTSSQPGQTQTMYTLRNFVARKKENGDYPRPHVRSFQDGRLTSARRGETPSTSHSTQERRKPRDASRQQQVQISSLLSFRDTAELHAKADAALSKAQKAIEEWHKHESPKNCHKEMEKWEELRVKMKRGVRYSDYVDFEKKGLGVFEELATEIEGTERVIRDEAASWREERDAKAAKASANSVAEFV